MNLRTSLTVCLLLLATSTNASADCGGLGAAYLYGYGGFRNIGVRNFASPPYFALHPPVYYGQRYTRPYGVSPYAAWPQLQSNPSYAPQQHVQRALVVENPYAVEIPVSQAEAEVVNKAPVTPVTIDNPYFQETTESQYISF
ncbi:MAG: hypothetical protein KDB22_18745 [Planctomycetales bacterium]|nr:hypothetical protein [Planctomycetales bacterium]